MPIVNCDVSGLEWRTVVFLAQDEVAIKEILSKADMHTDNQTRFNLGEGKAGRLIAKIFLFRLIYGGGAYSYANDSDFAGVSKSEAFWQRVIDDTYDKYKGLAAYHTKVVREAIEKRKVSIPSGRTFEFEHPTEERTKILNYPVQGFGADIVMVARISAFNRLKSYAPDVLFINSVHDSIMLDVVDEKVDMVCETLYSVFKDLPSNVSKMYSINFNIPLDCEICVGDTWGSTKEWKKS